MISITGKDESPEPKEKLKRAELIEKTHHRNEVLSVPRPLKSDALNRVQLISTFMGLYLPATTNSIRANGQDPATWVHILPEITTTNSAYNRSIAALCLRQVGVWKNDPTLLLESHRLYGSALEALRTTIGGSKLVAPEATLASIVILSTYEVSSCSAFKSTLYLKKIYQLFSGSDNSHGWVSHVHGGSRIAQMLRPGTLDGPVGQQLIERIKTIAVGLI